MVQPRPRLEIAFGVNASVEPTSSQWIDVSDDLRDFEGGPGGRQRNLDRIEAGEMTFVLSNWDRRYDPDYVAGLYYPNIVPNAHIRLFEDETSIPLFRGHVDGWPNEFPHNGKDSVVTIHATDPFKIMADSLLSRTVWEREVKLLVDSGDVTAWFRLGDPPGVTEIREHTGFFTPPVATIHGNAQLGQEGLLQSDETGATFPRAVAYIDVDPSVIVAQNNWTIEFLFRRPDDTFINFASQGDSCLGFYNAELDQWLVIFILGVSTNGFMSVSVRHGGNTFTILGTKIITDSAIHHCAIRRVSNDDLTIFIDGLEVDRIAMAVTDTITAAFGQTPKLYIGNDPNSSDSHMKGTLQEFVFYDGTAWSDAQILEHAGWALHPHTDVRSDQAISDALDDIDWPAGRRQITAGLSNLQSHELGGSALEYIQRVNDTEGGIFGIDGNGDAVFFGRQYVQSQDRLTPILTFGNDPTDDSIIPYETISFAHDDTQLVNEAQVSRENGNEFTFQDQDSIDRFLRHGWSSTSLLHDNDDEMKDHARYVVGIRKQFRKEVRGLTINLYDPRVDVETLLSAFQDNSPGLVLVEVIHTLTPNPDYPETNDPIIGKYRIEQITHAGSPRPRSWRVSLRLSPWSEDIDVPWILGHSVYGVLGVTTKLGF